MISISYLLFVCFFVCFGIFCIFMTIGVSSFIVMFPFNFISNKEKYLITLSVWKKFYNSKEYNDPNISFKLWLNNQIKDNNEKN